MNSLFLTYNFGKCRLNIVIFAELQYEYIFYLFERETPIRQTVAEFKRKIEGQISGDLDAPSSVCIKYLDVYDGMTHIPDNIINFEEVSE